MHDASPYIPTREHVVREMEKMMIRVLAVMMICSCAAEHESIATNDVTLTTTNDVTIQVPLYRQIAAQLLPIQLRGTTGSLGLVTEIPSLPVGAIITSVSARVTDAISKIGPTRLTLAVAAQGDGSIATVSPPSTPSRGDGTTQTLRVDAEIPVTSMVTYYAVLSVATGIDPTSIAALEIVYRPNSREVTIEVPLFDPVEDNVLPARFLTLPSNIAGQGKIVEITGVPVGATITRVAARVQDNTVGPTQILMALADQSDNSILNLGPQLPLATSNGSGQFQTLTVNNIATKTELFHTYYAGFFTFISPGTSRAVVTGLAVTYTP